MLLSILCHRSVEGRLRGILDEIGRTAEIVVAPDTLGFSIWARDALIALHGAEGAIGLIPRTFDRYDDAAAARLLAEGIGLPVRETDLALQGGNMLVARDALILGSDMQPTTRTGRQELDALAGGRDLIWIGDARYPEPSEQAMTRNGEAWTEVLQFARRPGSRQPLFHVDLHIALAGRADDGRDRIVAGCPRLASEMMGQDLPAHALADDLDAAAILLAESGFEVWRCPMPYLAIKCTESRRMTWTYLPYPNVWVERSEAGARVCLPAFAHDVAPGLAAMDQSVAALWRHLGFRVTPIPGCLALAENLGALNCMG
ncbi:MAG: hypothetical protein AAF317_03595, partial [Pseudomonadota bacterium]